MYRHLAEHLGHEDKWDEDLEAMQQSLQPLGFEVRSCHDERSGIVFLVLINTKSDALAQVATPYTASELQYIKTLVRC